jgi:hypothetical protein
MSEGLRPRVEWLLIRSRSPGAPDGRGHRLQAYLPSTAHTIYKNFPAWRQHLAVRRDPIQDFFQGRQGEYPNKDLMCGYIGYG